jgi:hypothetical protein
MAYEVVVVWAYLVATYPLAVLGFYIWAKLTVLNRS